MPREETLTAHGEVEYETVECASCGNTEMTEKSQQFLLGDFKKQYDWNHKSYAEIHAYDGYVTGNLCEYCADAEAINIDRDKMGTSGGIRGLLGGIRNAHSEYISAMVRHLNGEFGGVDADIINGVFMLLAYLMVIVFCALAVLPVLFAVV